MRCEPPPQPEADLGSPGIAAALLLGAGQWGSSATAAGVPPQPQQQQQQQQAVPHPLAPAAGAPASGSQALQPVVLQSLSLWVAHADGGDFQRCRRSPLPVPCQPLFAGKPCAQCLSCVCVSTIMPLAAPTVCRPVHDNDLLPVQSAGLAGGSMMQCMCRRCSFPAAATCAWRRRPRSPSRYSCQESWKQVSGLCSCLQSVVCNAVYHRDPFAAGVPSNAHNRMHTSSALAACLSLPGRGSQHTMHLQSLHMSLLDSQCDRLLL